MQTNCLPAWRTRVLAAPTATIVSGCPPVDGFTQCDPERMRANAERQMVERGLWPADKRLTLAHYTLARVIASEKGSGTPEELALLGIVYRNAARKQTGGDVNRLLLTRNSRGVAAYGPIHGSTGVDTAPFGRFASTARDPSARTLIVADLVLSGEVGDFAEGADDQHGPNAGAASFGNDWVIRNLPRRAARGQYWVGPVPGVNWFEIFAYMSLPSVAADSPTGRFLQARAVTALQPMLAHNYQSAGPRPRVDWSHLPVCGSTLLAGAPPVAVIGALGLVALQYARRRRAGTTA